MKAETSWNIKKKNIDICDKSEQNFAQHRSPIRLEHRNNNQPLT